MALESKANLKTKLEKRQRENSEPAPPAAVRGVQCGGRGAHTRVQDAKAEKRQKQEPKEVERYEPNYSSMAACISSLKEQEAEEERVAEATKQALFRKQQQAADKYVLITLYNLAEPPPLTLHIPPSTSRVCRSKKPALRIYLCYDLYSVYVV